MKPRGTRVHAQDPHFRVGIHEIGRNDPQARVPQHAVHLEELESIFGHIQRDLEHGVAGRSLVIVEGAVGKPNAYGLSYLSDRGILVLESPLRVFEATGDNGPGLADRGAVEEREAHGNK